VKTYGGADGMLHLFLTFALYDRVSAKEIVSDLRFEVLEDTLITGGSMFLRNVVTTYKFAWDRSPGIDRLAAEIELHSSRTLIKLFW
jgi:hypothetical protein